MNYTVPAAWAYWAEITKSLFWAVAGLMLLVAGIDYLYNFISFERRIKMTKQEVKDEFKRREVDPHLKARMRRMQRDMVMRRTLEKTKEATVLITNPTHFSIALKYELGMGAPILLAKGIDFLALEMRKVAKENKIPIIENRPLARELYATVEEGEEIPDKLYKVVAEIIRYVFKLKNKPMVRAPEAVGPTMPPTQPTDIGPNA
jgi:flagellar biosynthetic protein FlhB